MFLWWQAPGAVVHANEEYAIRVIRAGAAGFVVEAASTDELLVGIRKVATRGVYVTPSILEKMVTRIGQPGDESPESVLSDREMQVLVRLARGLSTWEVSENLSLSLSTVETYRSRVLEKLSLRNNSDMTRFAIRRGLVELDELKRLHSPRLTLDHDVGAPVVSAPLRGS